MSPISWGPAEDTYVPSAFQPDSYFAFVESLEELGGNQDSPPNWWHELNSSRNGSGLKTPSHCAWLDCVRSKDFLQIEWASEECTIGDVQQGLVRRKQITELAAEMFKVALVLLSADSPTENIVINQFAESAWHRVTLGVRAGIPTATGPDFDLADGAREYLKLSYYGACPTWERDSLLKVFNLNFIADARFDDEGGSTPTKGPTNPEGGAKADYHLDWNRAMTVVRDYEQSK